MFPHYASGTTGSCLAGAYRTAAELCAVELSRSPWKPTGCMAKPRKGIEEGCSGFSFFSKSMLHPNRGVCVCVCVRVCACLCVRTGACQVLHSLPFRFAALLRPGAWLENMSRVLQREAHRRRCTVCRTRCWPAKKLWRNQQLMYQHALPKKELPRYGCGSKLCTQNGTLVMETTTRTCGPLVS